MEIFAVMKSPTPAEPLTDLEKILVPLEQTIRLEIQGKANIFLSNVKIPQWTKLITIWSSRNSRPIVHIGNVSGRRYNTILGRPGHLIFRAEKVIRSWPRIRSARQSWGGKERVDSWISIFVTQHRGKCTRKRLKECSFIGCIQPNVISRSRCRAIYHTVRRSRRADVIGGDTTIHSGDVIRWVINGKVFVKRHIGV